MARFQVSPALVGRESVQFGDPEGRGRDRIFLGRLSEVGPTRDVIWDTTSETVFAIFGKRGSGKSYALGSILESLASRAPIGPASTSDTRAVIVFDTLGIFWTLARPFSADILSQPKWAAEAREMRRWKLDPAAISCLNLTPSGYARPGDLVDAPYVLSPTSLSGEDWCDLLGVDPYGDRIGQLMVDAWDRTTEQSPQWNVADLVGVVNADPSIQGLYAPETCRALSQRLTAFARLPLFDQPGTPLSELLTPGRVTVLSLAALSDELRRVLVSVVMRQILSKRAATAAIEKRLRFDPNLNDAAIGDLEAALLEGAPPTTVIIDEAQNVLPSERSVKSTGAIVKFVREGRNHGLSFGFTTQQPSAIDQRILAQVDTILCHKLTVASDLRRVVENLKSRNPVSVKLGGAALDFEDWIRSLDRGQCVVSQVDAERNFVIDVRPRVSPHAGAGA